jgi:hypothetical protein
MHWAIPIVAVFFLAIAKASPRKTTTPKPKTPAPKPKTPTAYGAKNAIYPVSRNLIPLMNPPPLPASGGVPGSEKRARIAGAVGAKVGTMFGGPAVGAATGYLSYKAYPEVEGDLRDSYENAKQAGEDLMEGDFFGAFGNAGEAAGDYYEALSEGWQATGGTVYSGIKSLF